jgi:hypothetical protein
VSKLVEKRKCDLLIWDDMLGPGTRQMVVVPSNISIAESKKGGLGRDVESKEKKCNCVDLMQGIFDKKKDKWNQKLLAEKKKVK